MPSILVCDVVSGHDVLEISWSEPSDKNPHLIWFKHTKSYDIETGTLNSWIMNPIDCPTWAKWLKP